MNRKIIAVVDDMFFASKIRATAEGVGAEIVFSSTVESVLQKMRERLPDLILVDLHNQRLDPFALAETIRSDVAFDNVLLLGFFSHVQTDLKDRAVAAGFNQVLPRSVFARELGKILSGE